MNLQALKKIKVHCDFLECHKQSWEESSSWTGWQNVARPTYAFVVICSDMKMEFSLRNGKTLIAKKGDIVFVPKNLYYTVSFYHTNGRFDSYTVNFLLKDESYNDILLDDEIHVLGGKFDESYLRDMEEFFQAYCVGEQYPLRLQGAFYDFLEKTLFLTEYNRNAYYLIKKGITALSNEWRENKKIDEYANLCGINKSYFYKLFKQWSGVSPNEYRNRLRLSEAKDLLAHTGFSVCEIAQKVGFDDPYYFSRLFKKAIGVSPLRFRKIKKEGTV